MPSKPGYKPTPRAPRPLPANLVVVDRKGQKVLADPWLTIGQVREQYNGCQSFDEERFWLTLCKRWLTAKDLEEDDEQRTTP